MMVVSGDSVRDAERHHDFVRIAGRLADGLRQHRQHRGQLFDARHAVLFAGRETRKGDQRDATEAPPS